MNLLLISSSYAPGGTYLEHCKESVEQFLDDLPGKHLLYIPYAKKNYDRRLETASEFFKELGCDFQAIHNFADPVEAANDPGVKAFFIDGGNTFRLISTLQDQGLLGVIRKRVSEGVGYMGASAGSLVACPTMMTTNDMPIVQPKNFQALNLVDFQINPHFVPGSLIQGHIGETREQRIKEYHGVNDHMVIGLPETAWINIKDKKIRLCGSDAVIFEKGREPHEWSIGSELPGTSLQ